ncbi:MAG: 5'-methylthioadenosine/adenosylhomocysteine nucleosidase [Buchnera aphidicola (Nurudea shiraii)]
MKKNTIKITIGIIGALKKELMFLYKHIHFYKKIVIYNKEFHIGKINEIKVILIQSGVGKVLASTTCTILLQIYKIDFIVNIGTAGSLSTQLKPGAIILPNSTCYHDINLTAFGYDLGQIKGFPKKFLVNNYLTKFIEICLLKLRICYYKGLIISGDSFVDKQSYKKRLKKCFPKAIAVDMESTAIAQVCYQFNKPFLTIKVISDFSNNNSVLDFKKFICLENKTFLKIIQYLLKYLYIK